MDNLGGIKSIWLFEEKYLLSIDDYWYETTGMHTIYLDWDEAIFYELDAIQDTISWSEKRSESENGPVYDLEIFCTIAHSRPSLRSTFYNIYNRKLLIATLDNNGYYRLHGRSGEYFLLSEAEKTGQQISDRNQVDLSFKRRFSNPSIFTNNPLVNPR